jgi:glutamate-ammonia-ligase adenylyltransferase
MARANLERWAAHLPSGPATFSLLEDPRLLDDLLRLFASSQYLSDILIREPTAYTLLLEPEESWLRDDLRAKMAAAVAPFRRLVSRLEALRRARRREFLRIGWRDLAGRADFESVVARISALAEALIEQALVVARAPLAEQQPEIDAQVRFAVIAMGKLGGRELNYSSDVDLLFLYDSATPDDPTHLRHATRLAEALFTALNDTTGEGRLFQVDMRLRPEGRYGALVRSFASYREYYDRWMETWERQALIKARPIAGDAELGQRFSGLAEERAYPSLHAATLFEDVRDMRAAIERRVERREQTVTNVKEGRGTIREIEFTVQLLQLLFGAQRPEIRTGNTSEALARLEAAGLLSAEERSAFAEHYRFFRTVEHRLQIMHDLPVRLVPEDPGEQRKLALRMGFSPEEADRFFENYRARADTVEALSRSILDRLTVDGVAAPDPLRLMILSLHPGGGGGMPDREPAPAANAPPGRAVGPPAARRRGRRPRHGNAALLPSRPPADTPGPAAGEPPVCPAPEPLVARLSGLGFREPVAGVEQLRGLTTGAPRFSLPVSTARLFADLAEPLLAAAAAAPDPDGALSAVAEVANRLGAHRTLYQTLRAQPDMLRVLCEIVGFSPMVRELALRSPELLDVLYDEPFREAERPVEATRGEMLERLGRAFSPADRLVALRRFQKRELLRVITRDLLLSVDASDTTAALSDLADACVEGVLDVLCSDPAIPSTEYRIPNTEHRAAFVPGFAVIALGRLGGRELHYVSDLDLLYVYEAPDGEQDHRSYEQAGAELTRGLQEWQQDGRLYEVDLRLRPEGKSGFMAVHLDAARRYYLGGRALTWERQALIKARPVAGDRAVGARFMEMVTEFVYGRPLSPEADADLRAMKRRVETERVGLEDRARHLKLGPGGLSDIEFLTQRLQLRHGAEHASLRVPGTVAALHGAGALDLLPGAAVGGLVEAYTFLTCLRQRLRLRAEGVPSDMLPTDAAELEILVRSLGYTSGPELLEHFRAITGRVREFFTQHFQSGKW